MKTFLKAAAFAALTLSATALPTVAHAQAAAPMAIIIVDMDRIGAESAGGKSGQVQLKAKLDALQARAKQLNDSFNAEADGLRKQQAANTIAPDALQAKARDLGQRQEAARAEVAGREQEFQRSQGYVRQQIFGAVGPIVQQVMREKGAQLVVARDAALAYNPALDVTADIIKRLDVSLPRVSATAPAVTAATPAKK